MKLSASALLALGLTMSLQVARSLIIPSMIPTRRMVVPKRPLTTVAISREDLKARTRKDGSVRTEREQENADAARLRREARAPPKVEQRKKMIMINQKMLKAQRFEEKVKLRGVEQVVKRPKPWHPDGGWGQRLAALTVGQWVEGTVVRLMDYGAWVDVGAEVEGFVHVRALREEFIRHPADVLTPGQTVQVCVKSVELSGKDGAPSPAEMAAVTAALERSKKSNREGGIAVSKSSEEEVGQRHLSGDGDGGTLVEGGAAEIRAIILRAKAAAEGSSLRLSCLPVTPRAKALERAHGCDLLSFGDGSFEEGQQVWGEVKRVTHFGAFVDVGAEAEAFLHVSEFPDRMIGQAAPDCFTRGQRLLAYVMELDVKANRLKLTKFRPKHLPRVPF